MKETTMTETMKMTATERRIEKAHVRVAETMDMFVAPEDSGRFTQIRFGWHRTTESGYAACGRVCGGDDLPRRLQAVPRWCPDCESLVRAEGLDPRHLLAEANDLLLRDAR